MRIVICEDDQVQLANIENTIKNYALMEDNGMEVVLSTTNPEEVIQFLTHSKADCYFLDIDLKHIVTGITLGSKIREKDPIASLIYVTTHIEMTYLTFLHKLAALDFVVKDEPDNLKNQVLPALKEAYRRYVQIGEQTDVQKLEIKTAGRMRYFDFEQVYFFEASPNAHKIILHLENQHIEFYGRLKNFENLHEDLYRCHKSFIVNKKKVTDVNVKERIVYLDNGETCLASARLIKGFKK